MKLLRVPSEPTKTERIITPAAAVASLLLTLPIRHVPPWITWAVLAIWVVIALAWWKAAEIARQSAHTHEHVALQVINRLCDLESSKDRH